MLSLNCFDASDMVLLDAALQDWELVLDEVKSLDYNSYDAHDACLKVSTVGMQHWLSANAVRLQDASTCVTKPSITYKGTPRQTPYSLTSSSLSTSRMPCLFSARRCAFLSRIALFLTRLASICSWMFFVRTFSALARWICSIRTRLFLNRFPLASR